jgi:(1->4)-alpha-D-glucan 1-alpha-D-glucosylmutase
MVSRQKNWPHTLSASSTHDTKRSEDVRAMINVLSEIPSRWGKALKRWNAFNAPHKSTSKREHEIPDRGEEYMLYQTLLGSWPLKNQENYVQRVQEFYSKALREAKIHSSWLKPNERYEKAALEFARKILDEKSAPGFLADFKNFHASLLTAGLYNALAQTLLKITSPGVPDFYQGTEMWNFSLVDPDNRRPVDYEILQKELDDLPDRGADLWKSIDDGRIKLYLIKKCLDLRSRRPQLFQEGAYIPLVPEGERRRNVVPFARHRDGEAVIVLAGRFFLDFEEKEGAGVGALDWKDTHVPLPSSLQNQKWRDVLDGRVIYCADRLNVSEALSGRPCTILERVGR